VLTWQKSEIIITAASSIIITATSGIIITAASGIIINATSGTNSCVHNKHLEDTNVRNFNNGSEIQ
jgi:hypothetical protein